MDRHYYTGGSIASFRADIRMSRAFLEDMFRSVGGLESLRVLRWCRVVFTRSIRPTGAKFAHLLYIHPADDC